jgi:hypothetical protein
VARELLARGVNVIAHVVGEAQSGGVTEISLGSNPDVTVDCCRKSRSLRARARRGDAGPGASRDAFMLGAGERGAGHFDLLLDHSRYDYDLFAPPNPSLSTVDHAIGLHASSLVRDGGTLQIGIGELGDSIVYSLLLRHQQNEPGARARDAGTERSAALIDASAAARRSPRACSAPRRCSSTRCSTCTAPASCAAACTTIYPAARAGRERLRTRSRRVAARGHAGRGAGPGARRTDVAALKAAGVLRSERDSTGQHRLARWRAHRANSGQAARAPRWRASAWDSSCRAAPSCTPVSCSGPRAFYRRLRELPESERRLFDMRGVGYINQLYGADMRCVAQRSHARFVNTTMMLTTLGRRVSRWLADGRVVPVSAASTTSSRWRTRLPGARSVLCVRSTRRKDGS